MMHIIKHSIGNSQIAEIVSDDMIIKTLDDALELLGDLYYQHVDKIILYEKNITSDFFNLRSGIAGEILQKFSTYRMQLIIVGDFGKYPSQSLKDFIYESNKGRQVNFVGTISEARNSIH